MDCLGDRHLTEESISNPLASLTDTQLWNAQVLLELGCGRNHSSLRKARRQYYCLLRQNLKIEADLRGVASPPAAIGVGDLRHDPNAPYVA